MSVQNYVILFNAFLLTSIGHCYCQRVYWRCYFLCDPWPRQTIKRNNSLGIFTYSFGFYTTYEFIELLFIRGGLHIWRVSIAESALDSECVGRCRLGMPSASDRKRSLLEVHQGALLVSLLTQYSILL